MSALQGINVVLGLLILLVGSGLILFRHFNLLFDFAWSAGELSGYLFGEGSGPGIF